MCIYFDDLAITVNLTVLSGGHIQNNHLDTNTIRTSSVRGANNLYAVPFLKDRESSELALVLQPLQNTH